MVGRPAGVSEGFTFMSLFFSALLNSVEDGGDGGESENYVCGGVGWEQTWNQVCFRGTTKCRCCKTFFSLCAMIESFDSMNKRKRKYDGGEGEKGGREAW